MIMKQSLRLIISALVVLATFLSWAGSGTWINTSSGGLWSLNANWSGNTIADGSGFTANFNTIDITSDNIVHLDGPRTLTALTFGDTTTNTAAGWVLDNDSNSANILTLAGTTPTITVNALGGTSVAAISAQLAGTAGLTKAGAGTLTLTTNNTYTGATTITGGTLALSGSGALVTNTTITINGGTLDMGPQNSIYNLGNNTGITFGSNGGNLNGTGTNTIIGTSGALMAFTVPANVTAMVNANVNITNTSAANFSGIASVGAGGTLILNGKIFSSNSGGNLWHGSSGTLIVNNTGNLFAGIGISGGGTLSTTNFSALGWYNSAVLGQNSSQPPATFIYTGPSTTTTFNFTPTCLVPSILNNGSGILTFSATSFNGKYGTPSSATAQKLTLGGSNDIIITGVIKDANASSYLASLVKTNANTLTLTGANTFSAGTVISGGTLQLGDGTSGRDGTVLSNILNNAALVYNLYSTQTVNSIISGTGTVTKAGAGTLTLAGANAYSGATTINAGKLKLGLASAITNTGAINVAGGTYDLGGFTVTNGAVNLISGQIMNGTLVNTPLACTNTGVLLANLSGSQGLTKSGSGALLLQGTSTFTGKVVITEGSLELRGTPAPGAELWLDAANPATLSTTTDGSGGTPASGAQVKRWNSLSGVSRYASTSGTGPIYQTNVVNGLPVLQFSAGSMTLNSNVLAQGSTVFLVYRQTGGFGAWQYPIYGNHIDNANPHIHLQEYNTTNRIFTTGGGWVEISSGISAAQWAVQALQIEKGNYRLWIDDKMWPPNTSVAVTNCSPFLRVGFSMVGDMAEIMVYTNILGGVEMTNTISYLSKKWFGKSLTSYQTNSLSPAIAAEVKTGAVLDLCGGSQTVSSLAGSGLVTNGTVTVTSRLTPGDTSAAASVMTVGGNLTLAAGATNAFDYVSTTVDKVSVAGTLTLLGANTVELSLNGQPPPTQLTLFTFGSLVGEGYLTAWSVQGAGLGPYATRVIRVENTIVLTAFRRGTLIRIQ